MTEKNKTLRTGFLNSLRQFPDRPAIEVDGRSWSYQQVYDRAASIASTLAQHVPQDDPPLTAVLAERSVTAYTGILAVLLRGHGYVPLNPSFPAQRTLAMLDRSECRAMIVDASGQSHLERLLNQAARPLVVLLPEQDDVSALAAQWSHRHTILGARQLQEAGGYLPPQVDPAAIAYLLFTSGSTGTPKGVMVSHRNVRHFLDVMQRRYAVRPEDRLTQIFELVFDLSVFDIFMAWEVGACVCCPSKADLLMPDRFIESSLPSIWFSVPSTALLLKKLGKLQPGAFPSLRLSLFCGEALTADVTSAWAEAASNSIVENLYGPTELTLACTLYRWDQRQSPGECENGVVPIGEPYPAMTALIVDDHLREVPPGEVGELLMAGPQVTLGYWKDPARTAAAFVVPPGRSELFYRTGDRVRRPLDSEPIQYLGRADHQVQIHGYRVELGEVEAALRDAAGVDVAVALGWPMREGAADRIIGFLPLEQADLQAVTLKLRERLPQYMVPREIRLVPALPLNSNGKVDRRALAAILDQSSRQPATTAV